jgi:hypothetical protein
MSVLSPFEIGKIDAAESKDSLEMRSLGKGTAKRLPSEHASL